ncbi:hypothetical protein ES703_15511 [subsurface metagenome]
MELEKARAIAEEVKRLPAAQLEFALEPIIEIAGRRFLLDECVQRRFWTKVHKTGNCWLWLAGKSSDGYGSFSIGDHGTNAHRVAYALEVGSIPAGGSVLHKCDNRACVRPEHLFLGTQLDNVSDMFKKGRGNKASGDRNTSRLYPGIHRWGPTHMLRLHPERQARGERVANAKLKESQVIEIRRRWKMGEASQHALAREYGVTLSAIHWIVIDRTWRHLL